MSFKTVCLMSCILLLSLCGRLCFAAVGFEFTAQDLENNCKEVATKFKHEDPDTNLNKVHTCLGYIIGAHNTHETMAHLYSEKMSDEQAVNSYRRYCLPSKVSVQQIARLLVKYLSEHPTELHYMASTVYFKMLQTQFPCDRSKYQMKKK